MRVATAVAPSCVLTASCGTSGVHRSHEGDAMGLRGLGDVFERGANPGTTLQGSERERERRATGGLLAALADR